MAKKTVLYDEHIKMGGKIVDFAGFLMPIQYKNGIISEVKRVRNTVGVFDVSHMGEIEIKGKDALEFVNHITVNDAAALELYQVQYSAMCYEDGGIVDDLLVYKLPNRYFLVVNASNTDKDYDWILKNKRGDVEILNISDSITQLAVQGPVAEKVVQKLTDTQLNDMPYYWSTETKVAGIDAVLSRTGYTGEDGFEIYIRNENGVKLWKEVFDAGSEFEIEPIGLGARDLLRLEMKYCLYGNDIDKTTNPLEAGLSWITKLDKEEFIGKDALLKQKEVGVHRRLVSFEMLDKGIPRHHYKILKDGEEIGFVTSGNFSPSVDKFIGLGYVNVPYHKKGTEIQIDVRGEVKNAVIVRPPFYKNASHK
ncbi:MAG: glycine cleavage system protein T [Candidatus Cloacimonas sp. 4484_209]|nr:MAG: glycine cleavage system protein T [Candidatus Cloacimonas sp. 4484_209]